jgi:hypothetical protein
VAEIASLNPRRIAYLQLAANEGLGNTSFIAIGESISFFKKQYPKKNVRKIMMGTAYNVATRLDLLSRLGIE